MTVWNAEHDQVIRDNRGRHTAEQIAGMINRMFGLNLTRNAVCGRVDRLDLPTIRMPGRPKGPRINGEHKQRKPAAKVLVSPPIPVEPLNILFGDLAPLHCREVVGKDGFQSLSCGHPKIEDSSYCRWHHAVNHTTAISRARPYYRV